MDAFHMQAEISQLVAGLDEDQPVRELTDEECWALLESHELGRLAFHLGPEVHLSPVNYAVDGRTLLFRTAAGSKLVGVVMNADVVFEIDDHDEHGAVSVIVRGEARRLDEDEAHRAENLPLRPWVPTRKDEVVEISPTDVTGRAFHLHRPWRHMIPED
ncbi:MAG TPA: pyridoxamine 5'-phosphate oxidase family protein [Marmoricola sp.]|nr:pyridoxamine 5'-phosphate oxidase family protein [Marmoricola sp.]